MMNSHSAKYTMSNSILHPRPFEAHWNVKCKVSYLIAVTYCDSGVTPEELACMLQKLGHPLDGATLAEVRTVNGALNNAL